MHRSYSSMSLPEGDFRRAYEEACILQTFWCDARALLEVLAEQLMTCPAKQAQSKQLHPGLGG